jgi:hypothetical protein
MIKQHVEHDMHDFYWQFHYTNIINIHLIHRISL